jgi:hypothetical protein
MPIFGCLMTWIFGIEIVDLVILRGIWGMMMASV